MKVFYTKLLVKLIHVPPPVISNLQSDINLQFLAFSHKFCYLVGVNYDLNDNLRKNLIFVWFSILKQAQPTQTHFSLSHEMFI